MTFRLNQPHINAASLILLVFLVYAMCVVKSTANAASRLLALLKTRLTRLQNELQNIYESRKGYFAYTEFKATLQHVEDLDVPRS